MPWNYSIDVAKSVLLVKATGAFSDTDLQTMRTVTNTDARFHPGIRALFDYLEVVESKVTNGAVASWPLGQLYGPNSRRAILVSPGLHDGIAQAFRHSIDQNNNGRVFVTNSREEALAWLNEGVPAEKRVQ